MRYLIALVMLCVVSVAEAQTPVFNLRWFYRLETAMTVNQTYQQFVTVDGVTVTGVPTCVQAGPDVSCTIPAPTLATGTHVVAVRAVKDGIEATTTINGFNAATQGPKNAVGFTYSITITVNPPQP
jgi:hypothetical protein